MDFATAFSIGRAFSHGWRALKKAPIPLLLGGFLMMITGDGGGGFNARLPRSCAQDRPSPVPSYDDSSLRDALEQLRMPDLDSLGISPAFILGIAMAVLLVVAAMIVLRSWLEPGYIRLHLWVLQTGTSEIRPLFSGRDRMWDMLLCGLLTGLIGGAASLVAALPGGAVIAAAVAEESIGLGVLGGFLVLAIVVPVSISINLGLALASRFVVLDGLGPMEAVRRSWQLARGNRWSLFVFILVKGLVRMAGVLAGLLACCIGGIVTQPAAIAIGDFAMTEAFLLATRGAAQTSGWALWLESGEARPPAEAAAGQFPAG